MNIFDIVIVLLIILSAISGFKQGVLKSGVKLVGTILVYIIAFSLKDKIGILLCKIFPFFELDGLVTLNILIYQLIAFILIASVLFGVFGLVMKLTGIIQKIVDLTIILTIPSKLLGAAIGLIEGYVILFIILVVLSIPLRNVTIFQESKLVNKMINDSPILTKSLGGIAESLTDMFKITSEIEKNEANQNTEINLEIMETFLKYNVISKEDALDLIATGKLDSVTGIEKFVKKI